MVTNILRYTRLYGYLLKFSAMLETEYRFSFILEVLVEIAFFIATMASMIVLFNNVTEVAGWNRYEMMVLYGMNMVFSEILLGAAFIFNLRELPHRIVKGELDLILVKPVNSLFAASLWRPYFASIPSACAGLVAAVYGFNQGNILFEPSYLLPFSVLLICGLVIAYSVGTMISCLSFWISKAESLPYLGQQFIFLAKHPFDIYQGVWRVVFLIFLPTAFMVSFPVQSLFGNFRWWWLGLGGLLATVFLISCNKVWNFGLKTYESASA